MENILMNSNKYAELAKNYGFDKAKWDKSKDQCLNDLLSALKTFSIGHGYAVEKSEGKELCININPDTKSGIVHGRTAGIYVTPTKGFASIYLASDVFYLLSQKYELPQNEQTDPKKQYFCRLSFCDLCSFVEAIVNN